MKTYLVKVSVANKSNISKAIKCDLVAAKDAVEAARFLIELHSISDVYEVELVDIKVVEE